MNTTQFNAIVDATAHEFGVPRKAIMSRARTGRISDARMTAMYLARQTGHTLHEVGRWFGRDHVSVSHGERKIRDWMSVYPKWKLRVKALEARLGLTQTAVTK